MEGEEGRVGVRFRGDVGLHPGQGEGGKTRVVRLEGGREGGEEINGRVGLGHLE